VVPLAFDVGTEMYNEAFHLTAIPKKKQETSSHPQ